MKLISLVLQGNSKVFLMLVGLGIMSGGIHVLLLININETLASLVKGDQIQYLVVIYTLSLLIGYLILNRMFSGYLIKFCQKTIHELRMKLMRSVLYAEYMQLKEEKENLYAAISKDTTVISHAILMLIQFITSLVTIIGCLVYLAYLSTAVFLFILIISVSGVGMYLFLSNKSSGDLENARKSEDTLFYHVRQVIDGFREIKVNSKKGEELVENSLQEASLENYQSSYKGFTGYFNSALISQFLFYLALILLVYIGSSFLGITATVLMNCVIVTLYLLGPLEMTTALMPQLADGNVAALRFRNMLDKFYTGKPSDDKQNSEAFESLKFEAVAYDYPVKETSNGTNFKLGPLGFELNKGEVTFIYGGNGAGKTTFIHLFLDLLKREKGTVFLNNKQIDNDYNLSHLFAPVFSDFHLFDALYGIHNKDDERVNKYLELFELEKKVTYTDRKFSSIKLSTGQRKRLALIAVLLEDRPILVLDEWAADQDPAFRRKFYTEVLPILKNEGYTIVAITHDDKYYDNSDALYRMEYGMLVKEKQHQTSTFNF